MTLVHRILRKAQKVTDPQGPDLAGDRDMEWSWTVATIPDGPGTCLDFGPAGSSLSLVAVMRGYRVTALDLSPESWHFRHPDITYRVGDILDLELPDKEYDLILNCSTVEHVGLAGRYGNRDAEDGDLTAMHKLHASLAEGGAMTMTVPVGRDQVVSPLHRVYGRTRLPRLLEGWKVRREEYWVKDGNNRWVRCERDEALAFGPRKYCYGLGMFVLG